MLEMILGILVAIIFSFFALQNTQPVTLHLQNYVIDNVPVYLVAITSLLIGIILSFVASLAGSISSAVAIFDKDQKIRNTQKALDKLHDKIDELESENQRLKASRNAPQFMHQSAFEKPNFFQRIRHRLSI